MLTPELEQLIQFALEDGELTEKERSVLMRKAQAAGVDLDEFEMILDAKLQQSKKALAATAPKPNSKHGEIRKCPACGATVRALTSKCSECGYEFTNIEAVKSANTLFERLQDLEMQKAKELAAYDMSKNQSLQNLVEKHNSGGTLTNMMGKERKKKEREDIIASFEKGARQIENKYLQAKLNLIKVYTVPNTKGDLLELLSMASSSAYDNDGVVGPEEEVWLQKTDQIYQKLIICAADDKVTLNQATSMIVSLIKRLPNDYKHFTRIPKELRDHINAELKAEKEDKKKEVANKVKSLLKGWRGIVFGLGILLCIIGMPMLTSDASGAILLLIGIIIICVMASNLKNEIRKAKNEDLLY